MIDSDPDVACKLIWHRIYRVGALAKRNLMLTRVPHYLDIYSNSTLSMIPSIGRSLLYMLANSMVLVSLIFLIKAGTGVHWYHIVCNESTSVYARAPYLDITPCKKTLNSMFFGSTGGSTGPWVQGLPIRGWENWHPVRKNIEDPYSRAVEGIRNKIETLLSSLEMFRPSRAFLGLLSKSYCGKLC